MKLKDVAEIIKGVHLVEGQKKQKLKKYEELTMVSLEPISFIDERKLITVMPNQAVSPKQLTKAGDVIVSLYHPMIACYVEKGQEGYVVPHYMALVRTKSHRKLDSRFIAQFINSARGRRALAKQSQVFNQSRPTTLPLTLLADVELFTDNNELINKL